MRGLIVISYFLFTLVFSLLTFILWARIALRYLRISPLHPVSQAINNLTNPVVLPFEHFFAHTKKKRRVNRYDWACFCILILVELLKFTSIAALFINQNLSWGFIPLYTLADLIVEPCNLLFYALIIRMVMSFVNPRWHHPVADVIRALTDPLLHLGHRIIPNISGFDFSPYLMLVLLKIITIYIDASLPLHLI